MAANASTPAPASPPPPVHQRPRTDFFRRFVHLAGAFWQSRLKWRARSLTAMLVALTFAQVLVPVAINQWSLRLFDALEQRAMRTFFLLIGVLVLIIAANALVTTTHLRVKRRLQVEWRSWLTGRVLDEWLSSPIYPGSDVPLHSGMAMQVDVIPSSPIYSSTRMEDGVVIADETLRREIGEQFPDCLARCQKRRDFMASVLGIPLPAEILPLSNIPAIVPPFFLSPNMILAMES